MNKLWLPVTVFSLKQQQRSQKISFHICNHLPWCVGRGSKLNHTTNRRTSLVSASTRRLFVCSFHLYPSVRPSRTSHSLLGDSMRERLDSLQLTSSLNYQHCDVSIVSLPRWEETKAEMCLHHESVCVFVLTKLQKSRHMRNSLCTQCSVQCLCVLIMLPHTQSLH